MLEKVLLADIPLNEPSQWLASLVEFKVGVMISDLNWATGDFWSVARLGVPGDNSKRPYNCREATVRIADRLVFTACLRIFVRLPVCLFVCLSVFRTNANKGNCK